MASLPPSYSQPIAPIPQSGSRSRRPPGSDTRPSQGPSNEVRSPAGQKARRGKKPKRHMSQQTPEDGLLSSAQDPLPETISTQTSEPDAPANKDSRSADFGHSIMSEWNDIPAVQNPESDRVASHGKKQPRKKSNRPKSNAPFYQAAAIDINQPRHPPANASRAVPSQIDARDNAQRRRDMTSEQRSPPPPGILGGTTTPAKLYAGPTFHASPAASSLPVPKFFSKSAPSLEKGPDLASHAHNESTSESSGSALGDSPTMKSSLRAEIAQAREPSPLDFFFAADRQEKAKRTQSDALGTTPTPTRTQSSSPLQTSRSHSRHPTGGSIFPMEMEGATLPKTPNERRTESSLYQPSPDSNAGDKARVKTEALKQLLQYGPRQTSSPLSQGASVAQSNALSSSPRPASQPRQASSGHSTPLSSYSQDYSPARNSGPFLPPSGPALSPQGVRPPLPTRPYTSHLRHEVSSNDAVSSPVGNRSSSGFAPSASTATPPQQPASSANSASLPNTGAYASNRFGPAQPNLSSLQAMSIAEQDALLHASLARHVSPSANALEDELRKVLKISPLPTSTTS